LKCTVAAGNVLSATGCVSSTSLWNGGVLAAANPACKACPAGGTCTGATAITCATGYGYSNKNSAGTYNDCIVCGGSGAT